MGREIFTVGHSNREAEGFFGLLEKHGVRVLADVRVAPGSRRHPQFGRDVLAVSCEARGIAYRWMRDLGGRRRASPRSPHTAWQVAAFRGYADYADTPAFAAALAELEALAAERPTAVMCAEARWWQCHRRLIADRLLVDGWEVLHILGPGTPSPHRLSEIARREGPRLVYDVGTTSDLGLGAGRTPRDPGEEER